MVPTQQLLKNVFVKPGNSQGHLCVQKQRAYRDVQRVSGAGFFDGYGVWWSKQIFFWEPDVVVIVILPAVSSMDEVVATIVLEVTTALRGWVLVSG